MKALSVIDPQIEADILAYHAGRELASEDNPTQVPKIGRSEVAFELRVDLFEAAMVGVV